MLFDICKERKINKTRPVLAHFFKKKTQDHLCPEPDVGEDVEGKEDDHEHQEEAAELS